MISWLRRIFGSRRSAAAAQGEDRVTAAEVTEYAESQVWPGFRTRAEAVESVVGYFADSTGPTDEATVSEIVGRVWQEREAIQTTWSDAGDWGRLAGAFTELERSGWVARMDFTCCQTCGHAEIEDERTGAEHSYVFFHWQDTEDPELGRRAAEQHARIETAVGATLVECLRRYELPVEWNGSHETRPFVHLRDWRKPLPVGS